MPLGNPPQNIADLIIQDIMRSFGHGLGINFPGWQRKEVDTGARRHAICLYANKLGPRMTHYARPADLKAALEMMSEGGCRVLAGGTDVYPGAGAGLKGRLVDVSGVEALRGIGFDDGGLRIGAATTWTEIADAQLPPALAGLQAAARQIGGRQVQNMGTIGGNLCNASPAADGVPPLLTLDAEVQLASARGQRRLAVSQFLTGPRRTGLAPDEIMVALHVPGQSLQGRAGFAKLGARAYLVISIAMLAVRLVTDGRTVTRIALSAGACSAVAQRLPLVEGALTGAPLQHLAGLIRAEDVAASLQPITDIRAPEAYRATAAVEMLRRLVTEVAT